MRQLKRDFILATALIAAVMFAFGYAVGTHQAAVQVRAFVECDTDSDCLEKNGCGGYADPCEVVK